MGIPGLTTYIENRAGYYLKPYELHDSILIIDGWSLSSQLYCTISTCNHAFGGDYDQFANSVAQFFGDLVRCKITPLVILDGGWERKKKLTIIKRIKQRIEIAGDYYKGRKARLLFPLLLPEVFVDVMKNMKIKYVMSAFEADDTIASMAKLLNVPVLSYDSDFFIYGVDYIPFNTLDPYISKYAKGYVKRCRIYRTDTLLRRFGLDISVLPLASILLGNDYINRITFAQLFNLLKIRRTKNQNVQQRRIEIIFDWLKNYSLNTAIAVILKRLPCQKRKMILQSIEMIVNGYSSISTYMLGPLGINEKSIVDVKKNIELYKFQGDCDNLDNIEEPVYVVQDTDDINDRIQDCDDANEENEDEEEEKEKEEDTANISDNEWNEDKFFASVPQWFTDDHLKGTFPCYFVNIITHHEYMIPVQVEDFSSPSAQKISFPIISTICSLLTTRSDEKTNIANKVIKLSIREGFTLNSQYISVPPSAIALEDIRNCSVIERKKIIDDTLEIRVNDKLNEFPPSWQLYIAAIIFWMRQNGNIERTALHLNTLLMSMLIGVIDRTTNFDRFKKSFRRNFVNKFVRIQDEQKYEKLVHNDETITMNNLISLVTVEDCTAVLPFFSEHTVLNNKLRLIPKKFRLDIVHIFAQFQSCLRHAMHLNALLGHIYIQPSPSEFLNGTLIYNMYNDFCTRSNVHDYIAAKFHHSLGLLRVFKVLNQKVFDALEDTPINEDSKNLKRKRHRNRRNQKSTDVDETIESQSDIDDIEASNDFYDPSNPFTLLCVG